MSWREFIVSTLHELQGVLRDDRAARLAALSGLAVLASLTLLTVLLTRIRMRRHQSPTPATPEFVVDPADFGDWGRGINRRFVAPLKRPAEAAERWPIDGVLPRRMRGTIALAVVIAASAWLAGLALAPSTRQFLASREWQVQPIYIAVHIIAVRLFVHVYARGFMRGAAYLDLPMSQARGLVRSILGFPGAITALVIAMPFVALDFLYLFSDRYAPAGGGSLQPIDYLMWGIWTAEWFLNAFIWVVIVGFLVKTWSVVRSHPFRAPIEIVLHDKHYKPFLQMGAEGASIVLAFTIVTVGYIWYTGGELTDYIGLAITAALLLGSFVPPWLLLRHKVRRAVDMETLAMRRQLLRNLELAGAGADPSVTTGTSPLGGDRALQHRLDAAVAILRISYLEGSHHSLGSTEARAVMVRMAAPAASVGWQVAKTHAETISAYALYLKSFFL